MKKTILIFTIFIIFFYLIGINHFPNSKNPDKYYSQPIREVEQLSSEYYLGPTIEVNKDNISNVKYYEELNGITESASPIGYYMQFEYIENNINYEITISSYLLERYDVDIKSPNVLVYKENEIYLWEIYNEEGNLSNLECQSILKDYVTSVSVFSINDNTEDIVYEDWQAISLEFMHELIDDYLANNH